MAATVTDQDKTRIPLKLLVDQKRNRVVLAEASKDFVDILFGFMALPVSKIMKIIGNQEFGDIGIGVYHLYQSVKDLGDDNFSKTECKSSLLNPRNRFADDNLKNLKVKIVESMKKFKCSDCGASSEDRNGICNCGGIYNKEKLAKKIEGAFLKGGMFIVSDDLKVTLNSPAFLVQQLSNLGITDMNQVADMSVEAGIKEITSLLKHSLISKTPLTDVFLATQGKSKNLIMPEPRNFVADCNGTSSRKLSLKLVLRKSTNRVLCAEASDEFMNVLFSFLTIPLGSVIAHLHGQTGVECIDNLYKSVENLEAKWLSIEKESLLKPRVGYRIRSEPLRFLEYLEMAEAEQLLLSCKFVKTPSSFLVSDELVVKDLSSTSCIAFLKELNIPFSDIEERIVTVGDAEALGILKASLSSSSVLTNGLNSLLKKHKREDDD